MSYFNRRDFLKVAGLSTTLNLIPGISFGANDEVIIGHNDFKYKVNKEWGLLDASVNPVNNCHEMAEDRQGNLYLLTDETKNNVLVYSKSGKLIKAWGNSYPGAHGLSIAEDASGKQFLLIADNKRAQVIKTDLNGKELMVIEYPKETGQYDYPGQFVPTETAVNPKNGDIYVVDGYGKSIVTQYTSKGEYIRHWGGFGDENKNLSCSHGIVIDSRNGKEPSLIITSRNQACWKRFTMDGTYLSTIELPGSFICRPVIRGENLYGAVYRSTSQAYPDSGYIQVLDKNDKVVSTPGGSQPIYVGATLQEQRKEDPLNVFMHPHDVYVDSDESIYIAQWASKKTYPIKLERV